MIRVQRGCHENTLSLCDLLSGTTYGECANINIWPHDSLTLSCKIKKVNPTVKQIKCSPLQYMLITLLLSFKPLAFIKLVNLMKDVSNAALTHPLGCLRLWFVATGALQGALPLFTATLHVQTSHCACKQQLHANITVPLLIRAHCNYIIAQALTSREQVLLFCDNSTRPRCFLAALWPS